MQTTPFKTNKSNFKEFKTEFIDKKKEQYPTLKKYFDWLWTITDLVSTMSVRSVPGKTKKALMEGFHFERKELKKLEQGEMFEDCFLYEAIEIAEEIDEIKRKGRIDKEQRFNLMEIVNCIVNDATMDLHPEHA